MIAEKGFKQQGTYSNWKVSIVYKNQFIFHINLQTCNSSNQDFKIILKVFKYVAELK